MRGRKYNTRPSDTSKCPDCGFETDSFNELEKHRYSPICVHKALTIEREKSGLVLFDTNDWSETRGVHGFYVVADSDGRSWAPSWYRTLAACVHVPLDAALRTRLYELGPVLSKEELADVSVSLRLSQGGDFMIEVARVLCTYSARTPHRRHTLYFFSGSGKGLITSSSSSSTSRSPLYKLTARTLRRIKKSAERMSWGDGLPPSAGAVHNFKTPGMYADIVGEMFRRDMIDQEDLHFDE